MTEERADQMWDALVRWKRARERFQVKATYDTTHAYCAAVEELEKLVEAGEFEIAQEAFFARDPR